jgi:IclR family KDG regulon transcriptional repressor
MSVQSLDRAFDLLELLAGFPEGLALSEISGKIELHKSTIHRLLGSLKERGYVEQDEASGRYRTGLGFIALAAPYLKQLDLKSVAEPEMRRLSDKIGVTVYLATLRDDEVVYLDKVERYDGFRRFDIIGRHVPVHCTSLGKSLLMDKDTSRIREILRRRPPVRKTPKTIMDIQGIIANIEECRLRGWSSDLEEHEMGVNCVGAPLRDYRGQTVAAISAVWKTLRSGDELEESGRMVAGSAAEISKRLGAPRD